MTVLRGQCCFCGADAGDHYDEVDGGCVFFCVDCAGCQFVSTVHELCDACFSDVHGRLSGCGWDVSGCYDWTNLPPAFVDDVCQYWHKLDAAGREMFIALVGEWNGTGADLVRVCMTL